MTLSLYHDYPAQRWQWEAYDATDEGLESAWADLEWERRRIAADDTIGDDVRANTLTFLAHRLEPIVAELDWRRRKRLHKFPPHTGYSRDTLDNIRQRVNLVHVIENRGLQVRKVGKSWRTACPFHQGSNPDALAIWRDPDGAEHFRCFSCGAGGDVFTVIQALDRLDFRQAVEGLANVAGVDLPDPARRTIRIHYRGDAA